MGALGPDIGSIVADDRLAGDGDRVAAGLVQRLRTNLTLIGGWAATLDDDWERLPDPRRRAAVATIRRIVDDLLADAAEGLARARAELDVAALAAEPIDIRTVLEVAADAGDRVLHLSPPSAPLIALADPAALQQVLGKVLENAAGHGGGARTVVTARRNPRTIVIEVTDEGPGLPMGVDVFAPFVRGPGATGQGQGLGLYIARELARAMGGDVTGHDRQPTGTTMRIHLPAARARA